MFGMIRGPTTDYRTYKTNGVFPTMNQLVGPGASVGHVGIANHAGALSDTSRIAAAT